MHIIEEFFFEAPGVLGKYMIVLRRGERVFT